MTLQSNADLRLLNHFSQSALFFTNLSNFLIFYLLI